MVFLTALKKTVLTVCIIFIVASMPVAQTVKPVLKFDGNGRFKIMQLTDIHYNLADSVYAQCSIEFIRESVAAVAPDLIMLTGDVVVSQDTRRAWRNIADVLSEFKIPWAVVFGNHDPEKDLTNRQIIELLSDYPFNLTENGPENISGNGNYVLTVAASASDGKTAAILYCLDSKQQHQWIAYDQMDWYRQQSRRFCEQNGGTPLPALAFYHIPVPEFKDVIGDSLTIGLYGEEVCSPTLNSGSFVAMYECRDVMGIFVGHDHDNNYIGCLHNICLAYGYKSGRQSYGTIGRGVRVIELCEGERKFITWLLKLYDCNPKEKTWIRVKNLTPLLRVTYPDSFRKP
jgi:hypothetical protein